MSVLREYAQLEKNIISQVGTGKYQSVFSLCNRTSSYLNGGKNESDYFLKKLKEILILSVVTNMTLRNEEL